MKKRIISGIVAMAIVIPVLIIGGYPYIVGVCILAMLAYKEMLDLKISHNEIPIFMKIVGLISLIMLLLANITGFDITYGFTYQRIIGIMLLILTPVVFYKDDRYTTRDAFYLIGTILFLGFIFNLLIVVYARGIFTLLYLIAIPMFTDIFAYLGGSAFGRHKMCPSISPNKSWEGAFIGLVFGTTAGTILHATLIGSFSIKLILVTCLLSIMGQVGDLVMSKVKRENKIKDFSNIMPGHGGILDRLDSIIFVTFTYVLLVFLI